MTTIVDSSTDANAVAFGDQRQLFYLAASGYWMLFYYDGTNIVYRTSGDGITWSAKTTVRACPDYQSYAVEYFPEYNPNYVYRFVLVSATHNGAGYFCRGTISGTPPSVAWGTEYNIPWSNVITYNPNIGISKTNGKVFVGVDRGTSYNHKWTVYGTINNDGNGGWAAKFYGPTILYPSDHPRGSFVALNGDRMLAIWNFAGLFARYYDGTNWDVADTVVSGADGTSSQHYGSCAYGDYGFAAWDYLRATSGIHFCVFTVGSGWGTIENVSTFNTDFYTFPFLSGDSNGNVWCFCEYLHDNIHAAKRTFATGTWGADLGTVLSSSTLGVANCDKFVNGNSDIGLCYTDGLMTTVLYWLSYNVAPPPTAKITVQVI
jgi:hypothetical protein